MAELYIYLIFLDHYSNLEDHSSNLEGNLGGTLTISLSEFLQNKIGMVGAYWLGFNRGFRNAFGIILAIWRIIPPIWRIILEELTLYLFLSSSKNKIGMVGAYWLGFKRGFRNAI